MHLNPTIIVIASTVAIQSQVLAEPSLVDTAVKTAIEKLEASENLISSKGKIAIISFSSKSSEKMKADQPPFEYTYSGKLGVPLTADRRPTLIRYDCGIPAENKQGNVEGSFLYSGVAKYESGSWTTMETGYRDGDNFYPSKEMVVSKPGYENRSVSVANMIRYSPLRFTFGDDPEVLRLKHEGKGMKGLLQMVSERGSVPGLQVEASKENPSEIVFISGNSNETSGARQTIRYDLSKGISPVSFEYTEDVTDPKRSYANWSASGLSHNESFGWLPKSIKGEWSEQGKISGTYEINLESVEVMEPAAAGKLFQQDVGPGWTVEDQVIGETFELGSPPKDILEKVKGMNK